MSELLIGRVKVIQIQNALFQGHGEAYGDVPAWNINGVRCGLGSRICGASIVKCSPL